MGNQSQQIALLQQENAQLVASNNALVAAIREERAGITAAIAAAVAAAPSMHKVFTVDPVGGDDVGGLGTDEAPFATIKKAVDSVPQAGSGIIKLAPSSIHRIDSNISYSNKKLNIYPQGSTPTAENKPQMVFTQYSSDNFNHLYGFVCNELSGNVVFNNCRFDIEESNYAPGFSNSVAYAILQSPGNATGSSFYVRNSEVSLGENGAALLNCHNSCADITLLNNTFTSPTGDIVNAGTTGQGTVSVNSCTKEAGANWYNSAALVRSNV